MTTLQVQIKQALQYELKKYDEDIASIGEELICKEQSIADIEERLRELVRTTNAILMRLNKLEHVHPICRTCLNKSNYKSGSPWSEREERALKDDLMAWLNHRNEQYHHRTPLALAIKLKDKLMREICRDL